MPRKLYRFGGMTFVLEADSPIAHSPTSISPLKIDWNPRSVSASARQPSLLRSSSRTGSSLKSPVSVNSP